MMLPMRTRWLVLSVLSFACSQPELSSHPSNDVASTSFALEASCERGTDENPANTVDDCDEDADNDGISNKNDVDSADPKKCWDKDSDGCDDCAIGVDGSGPLADNVPSNDGLDTDFDGKCDLGDPDDDNDGVCDGELAVQGVCRAGPDTAPLDATRCLDTDADGCDDCNSGKFDVRRDGADGNADGSCDLADDEDGDGVIDTTDLDADNDGIPDALENVKGIDPDGDADGDGVPNQWDSDNRGDGFANVCNDRNGDGRCDSTGLLFDVDKDENPNHLDLDSDGDGIFDAVEAGFGASDTNGDGTLEGDVGANGLLDALETSPDSAVLRRKVIDTDGDGAIDALDTDSDADGTPDGTEGTTDGDEDGIPDAYDPVTAADSDSDGDGFSDATECPSRRPCVDTNDDGVPDYMTPDEDGDGIASDEDLDDDNDGILDSVEGDGDPDDDGIPSRLDLDSDGDGIFDVDEARVVGLDANRDGRVDGEVGANGVPDAAESAVDSGTVAAPVDTDGDKRPDTLDLDSDADGVPDADERGMGERPRDSDGDKTPDYRDTDDDNDGIPTKREIEAEDLEGATPDADDQPAYLDADSDGDGRPDADEGDVDRDGNGIPDFVDAPVRGPDSDGDGYLDEVECQAPPCRDLDGDGLVDMLDTDDDGDGVPTSVERTRAGSGDTDGDGRLDAYDDDDDGDGVPTRDEEPGDTDGDGIDDILDPDDDGDGVSTLDELELDSDADGTPDRLSDDDDGDGILTRVELSALDVPDLDLDGLPQHRDADDDGDGLSTQRERPSGADLDTDRDGKPNHYDADDDGDGVETAEELDEGEPRDTDGEGIADHLDTDDDGDGILTRDELGDEDGNDVPDYLEEPGAGGTFGGAALCSSSPRAGSDGVLLAMGFLLLALGARRRWIKAAGVVAALSLFSAHASAQVAVEQFRPALLREDGFGLARPVSLDPGRLSVAFMLDYARESLVYERPNSRLVPELPVIEDHLVGHVGLSVGLGARFTLTGSVPMHLVMKGEDPGPITPEADGAGLGDVALNLRGVFADGDHVGFGAELTARLPTAELVNGDQTYSGDELGSYEPALILEGRAGRFDARARVGARFRKPVELRNFELGQEFVYGAGARLMLVKRLYAHLEATGSSAFKHFAKDAYSPLEALLGLKYQGEQLYAGVAGGPGILSGYGSPLLRVVATLGYALAAPDKAPPPPVDRDGDGVNDAADRCPLEAEDKDGFEDEDGCPDADNDGDGVADADDRCPTELEDKDGFADEDGCPDTDNDGDGIADADDRCPAEPEDKDGFADDDGCPDPDNDGDGIADVDDACPNDAGVAEQRGCAAKPLVEKTKEQLVISERVEFETGKDGLLESSHAVLEAVAKSMAEHTDIERIRVEGHADDSGPARLNMRLSKKRSASVVRWLVEHGVPAERLEAYGCGKNRPLDPAKTDEARQKNRRVEFHIVDANKKAELEGCERAETKR
jgi:outer membrane protein OmpA-like peptidoglycan-associated protein